MQNVAISGLLSTILYLQKKLSDSLCQATGAAPVAVEIVKKRSRGRPRKRPFGGKILNLNGIYVFD